MNIDFNSFTTLQWILFSAVAFLVLLMIILFFVFVGISGKAKKIKQTNKSTQSETIVPIQEPTKQVESKKTVVTTTTTTNTPATDETKVVVFGPIETEITEDEELPSDVIIEEIDETTEEIDEVSAKETTSTNSVAIYHVSQNKNQDSEHHKRWRIRRQGSQKTIKYFDTQKEALEVAKDLADSNDGSVILHGLDGKIRRQKYPKKSS